MWICLNDAFLSLVAKDCARDELLVRARRKGDIELIFPEAKVIVSTTTDYRYRAVVKRGAVARALDAEVRRITYPNFKDSVRDDRLHNAYLRVWSAMARLQPLSRGRQAGFDFIESHIPRETVGAFDDVIADAPAAKRKKRRRKPLTAGR